MNNRRLRAAATALAVSGAITLTALPAQASTVGTARKVSTVGDSYPDGTGGNEGNAYPERYARRTGQGSANHSHPGWKSSDVLYQFSSDPRVLASIRASRTVVVTIGANDISMAYPNPSRAATSLTPYGGAMRNMRSRVHTVLGRISAARGGNNKRVVVLNYNNIYADGTPLARKGTAYATGAEKLTQQVNNILMAECRAYGMSCVNVYPSFDVSYVNTLVTADGTHPSSKGHIVYSNRIYAAVR